MTYHLLQKAAVDSPLWKFNATAMTPEEIDAFLGLPAPERTPGVDLTGRRYEWQPLINDVVRGYGTFALPSPAEMSGQASFRPDASLSRQARRAQERLLKKSSKGGLQV